MHPDPLSPGGPMFRSSVSRAGATTLLVLGSALLAGHAFAQGGATGTLKVEAAPGRPGVFVDGKYLGPAANFKRTRSYTLPAGSHDVVLREPRYRDVTTKVTIEAGKTATIKQKLEAVPIPEPPFGKLKTKAPDKFTGV